MGLYKYEEEIHWNIDVYVTVSSDTHGRRHGQSQTR